MLTVDLLAFLAHRLSEYDREQFLRENIRHAAVSVFIFQEIQFGVLFCYSRELIFELDVVRLDLRIGFALVKEKDGFLFDFRQAHLHPPCF